MEELASVYLKYAAKKNLKSEIVSSSDGSITLEFRGHGVWNAFKNEPGKHVVQRCHGKRQTSVVAVGVLPIFEFSKQQLKDDEIEIKTQNGHGPGGQHQNKTASAVRMVHKPTGLQVFINGRSQQDNRRLAREILTARVNQHLLEQNQSAYSAERRGQLGDTSRGDKVRTYNFYKNLVHDHRLDRKTTQIKDVMKGDLDLLWN